MDGIADTRVEMTERLVLSKIESSVPEIARAISAWDSSKQKPTDLRPRMLKLRRFYGAVIRWRRAYQARAEKAAPEKKAAMLMDFVGLCREYENS